MTNSWNFGPIYCSKITKILLQNKFPDLICEIIALELNKEYVICLNKNKKEPLKVKIVLFEANHCPGAVMFLFKGYMGTILYTGDFRFEERM